MIRTEDAEVPAGTEASPQISQKLRDANIGDVVYGHVMSLDERISARFVRSKAIMDLPEELLGEAARRCATNGELWLEHDGKYLAEILRRDDARDVLGLIDRGVGLDFSIGQQLWRNALSVLDEVSANGLRDLVEHLEELAMIDMNRAQQFVNKGSAAYVQFIRQRSPSMTMEECSPVLSHYIAALCGKQVNLEASKDAITGPDMIRLPAKLRMFGTKEENFIAYKAISSQEAAHIEHGTFDFICTPLMLERIIAEYGAPRTDELAGSRDQIAAFCASFPEPDLAEDIFSMLEDVRVYARTLAEYPGLRGPFALVMEKQAAMRPDPVEFTNGKQQLLELCTQQLLYGRACRLQWDRLSDASMLAAHLRDDAAGVQDAADATISLYIMISEASKDPYEKMKRPSNKLKQRRSEQDSGKDEQAADRGKPREGEGDQLMESDMVSAQLPGNRMPSSGKGSSRDKSDENGQPGEEGEMDDAQLVQHTAQAVAAQTIGKDYRDFDTCLYPEWDKDVFSYRDAWTRVWDCDAAMTPGPAFIVDPDIVAAVKREFEQLRPERYQRMRKQYDGEDLDIDALIEYIVDMKAKGAPDERVYTRMRKNLRDVAVLLLVDASKSTADEVTGAKVIDIEKQAVAVFGEALSSIGDEFAIYGFSGFMRDHVECYKIKSFDERVTAAYPRIAAMEPMSNTRIGAAVRHATAKLAARPERTRLLLLLTDGKPHDTGYEDEYAIEDTRVAIQEAGMVGINSFCITIDKEASSYLPRMLGAWALVPQISLLPRQLLDLYKKMTF
jgi:nitric oxide reductase NorD protein